MASFIFLVISNINLAPTQEDVVADQLPIAPESVHVVVTLIPFSFTYPIEQLRVTVLPSVRLNEDGALLLGTLLCGLASQY